MVTKQATRIPNSNKLKIGEFQSLSLGVPDNVLGFFEESHGFEVLSKLKDRKNLSECEFSEEDKAVHLSGIKENLDGAAKFLNFYFDNLM